MPEQTYTYVVVGGGLAGASAVEGIRERDLDGSILLICGEPELPYHRPPLSKQLWSGKKKPADIFIHDQGYYVLLHVDVQTDVRAAALDGASRTVLDSRGHRYRYDKLLLATGGSPKRLSIPGGELEGIEYYRTLADYHRARAAAGPGQSATVIGGGFIGSEMAAALHGVGVEVSMLFPGESIAQRVLPADLSAAVTELYRKKGVKVLNGQRPTSIAKGNGRFRVRTEAGQQVDSDLLIVGIGIDPDTKLAEMSQLQVGDGVIVNERLQTSDERIYAAGDNANFPCEALGRNIRVEHWDNAKASGKCAGRNMAGAEGTYDYVPYFFSDLFELGYEAVGEVDSRLATIADWQKEFETGVVYYLRDGVVRGVLLCNLWGKVEAARQLVRTGKQMSREELKGAIR